MSMTAKNLCRDEFFYEHKACAGCGGSLAVRNALKVLGKNAVAVLPAGCMSAVGFNFPQLCFANNAIISTFAGTASMLTGIEAGFRARGIKDLDYLKKQSRFRHLTDDDIQVIIQSRDVKWEKIRRNWRK